MTAHRGLVRERRRAAGRAGLPPDCRRRRGPAGAPVTPRPKSYAPRVAASPRFGAIMAPVMSPKFAKIGLSVLVLGAAFGGLLLYDPRRGHGVLQARRRGDGRARAVVRQAPAAARLRHQGLDPPQAREPRLPLHRREQGPDGPGQLHGRRPRHLQGRRRGGAEGPARPARLRRRAGRRDGQVPVEVRRQPERPGARSRTTQSPRSPRRKVRRWPASVSWRSSPPSSSRATRRRSPSSAPGGARRRSSRAASARSRWSRRSSSLASAVLISAFVVAATTAIKYVAANSDAAQPLFYRVTAFWGGLDGSILFWAVLLSLSAVVAIRVNRETQRELIPYVVAIVAVGGDVLHLPDDRAQQPVRHVPRRRARRRPRHEPAAADAADGHPSAGALHRLRRDDDPVRVRAGRAHHRPSRRLVAAARSAAGR